MTVIKAVGVSLAEERREAVRVEPEALAVMVVEAAGIIFAVPARAVARVADMVPVTPLPLVPSYVDGLVALGGAILPQIDLRRRLALPDAGAVDGGALLLVAASEGGYALRVDRVVTLTVAAPGTIRVFGFGSSEGGAEGVPPGLVVGELPWRDGRTALVLHPDRLGLQELEARGGEAARTMAPMGSVGVAVPAAVEPHHVYVLARYRGQAIALPVTQVVEVVACGSLTPVPGAPPELLGLTRLRGRPLPVVAPAVTERGERPDGVLIVVEAACGRFALSVECVTGIRSFPLSRIHASAEAVSGGGEGRAGYLVDAGERVIGLLDVDRMASGSRASAWRDLLPVEADVSAPTAAEVMQQLLVFRVGPEWCALDVQFVIRMVDYRVPQPVPAGPDGFAGLVEIGGEVLPMVDLRIEMGAPTTVCDWTALIVVERADGRYALAVDRIDRLVTVPTSVVQTAAARVHRLVTAIVRVGDRLVSLLDLAVLFKD